jgi:hypothetical protein
MGTIVAVTIGYIAVHYFLWRRSYWNVPISLQGSQTGGGVSDDVRALRQMKQTEYIVKKQYLPDKKD